MNILCITDQFEGSNHSAVEGIFGKYLSALCRVFLVFFSRELKKGRMEGNRIVLPYSFKHRNILKELENFLNLEDIDFTIIRNFFPVLKSVLARKDRHPFQIGFWESFPHDFRRYFEAKFEKKALLRKRIEYKWSRYQQRRLIKNCNFIMLVSDLYKKSWYPDFDSDVFILPLGVDFEGLPGPEPHPGLPFRFIHTGTVDPLRCTDLIAEAFSEMKEDFVLHFFTASNNKTVKKIKELRDPRIKVLSALPREALFYQMKKYDLGIGLIPNNELYRVSSPTKTLEYYALGIPALLNHLPEYDALFNEECAFFADFTKGDLQKTLKTVFDAPRERLLVMGEKGRAIVKEKRNYEHLAGDLYQFLKGMTLKATFAKIHGNSR
jgi:Glycosyl transferases group 1